jgi:hypothetical protein
MRAITVDPRLARERGTILVVLMILFVGFGAFASASLAKVLSEDQRVAARLHAAQAQVQATSQLELAKNLVNASSYDGSMRTQVLHAALAAPDQVIPGTDVRVEQVGATRYFRLRTAAMHRGVQKSAEAVVREASPASQYNLFVIDHPVGLCGEPRGAIHTNKFIDFFFPGGHYRDSVTAGEGFNLTAGATADNTKFSGVFNPAAPAYDILEGVDFAALAGKADTLSVTDDLIAEVEFQGPQTEIRLYEPEHFVDVPATKTWSEFSHWEDQTYTEPVAMYEDQTYVEQQTVYEAQAYTDVELVPVYAWKDVTRTVTEDVFSTEVVSYTVDEPVWDKKKVTKTITTDVWIPFDKSSHGASSGGGTVGASGKAAGFWKKFTKEVDVWEDYVKEWKQVTKTKTVQVKTGTKTYDVTEPEAYVDHWDSVSVTKTKMVPTGTVDVTKTKQVFTGWKDVVKTKKVPIYVTKSKTYTKQVLVAEKLVDKKTIDSDGVVYLKGPVRKLSGELEGRLSLITSGSVRITGDVRYVDADGDSRMLNGGDMSEPYAENPDYEGNSLLAVMADQDILYAKDAPEQLEVNASLISAHGSVSFEGVKVDVSGTDVYTDLATGGDYVKDSLRRLGGIVSRFRPVATYIDEFGHVGAGFENGESIMDDNLILSSGTNAPPPFMFEAAVPTWVMSATGRLQGL